MCDYIASDVCGFLLEMFMSNSAVIARFIGLLYLPECHKHKCGLYPCDFFFVNISSAPKSFDLYCFLFKVSVPMLNISLGC